MSETVVVLRTAKQGADRLPSFAYESNMVMKKSGWTPKAFDKGDFEKLDKLMTAKKKDTEYCVSLDAWDIKYLARVGTERMVKDHVKLTSMSGHEARFKMLDFLVQYGVI